MKQYDAIIIGTGQAGPSLASRLSAAGKRVAVIERKLFGGTCVNTGCIPTKTLVASAYAAQTTRRGSEYGVQLDGSPRVDMKKVKARKDEIVAKSNQGVEKSMRDLKNSDVYQGHARFVDSQTVAVGDDQLRANQIFINVGGRAIVPPLPGVKEVSYFTNSSIMNVDFLPEHLVIIGGGYIGLEFGQMYRRFGSQVTIVEMGPRLIKQDDEDVSAAAKSILENEGVQFRLNAECISLHKTPSGIGVGLECKSGDKRVTGSHVLLAVGRRPNTDDLGLEKAGVKTDPHGYIQVDDQLRTNVPGIWAWEIATEKEHSRILPTMILKSLLQICWTMIRGA